MSALSCHCMHHGGCFSEIKIRLVSSVYLRWQNCLTNMAKESDCCYATAKSEQLRYCDFPRSSRRHTPSSRLTSEGNCHESETYCVQMHVHVCWYLSPCRLSVNLQWSCIPAAMDQFFPFCRQPRYQQMEADVRSVHLWRQNLATRVLEKAGVGCPTKCCQIAHLSAF